MKKIIQFENYKSTAQYIELDILYWRERLSVAETEGEGDIVRARLLLSMKQELRASVF